MALHSARVCGSRSHSCGVAGDLTLVVWQQIPLLQCGSRSHSCGLAADLTLAVWQQIPLLLCGSRPHFCPILYCHVPSLASLVEPEVSMLWVSRGGVPHPGTAQILKVVPEGCTGSCAYMRHLPAAEVVACQVSTMCTLLHGTL